MQAKQVMQPGKKGDRSSVNCPYHGDLLLPISIPDPMGMTKCQQTTTDPTDLTSLKTNTGFLKYIGSKNRALIKHQTVLFPSHLMCLTNYNVR